MSCDYVTWLTFATLIMYILLNGPICVMLPKASKDDKNVYNYDNNFANVYTT